MKVIFTIVLLLMTIGLTACGILLWRRRKETGDYSRHIQAIFSWLSALTTFVFIFRTWNESLVVDATLFEPEHTFVPLLMQMTFFLYPLEVIRPSISKVKVYALLLAPLLILVFVGMCAGIEYTTLNNYADLWLHLGEFNVWFRLFAICTMLFYCFSLFLVQYDWRRSSVDKKLIMAYAMGFCLIGLLHFLIQLTHAPILVLFHQIAWTGFFFGITHYELNERLVVMPDQPELPEESTNTNLEHDHLWKKILVIIDDNKGWRNPDMNLSTLTQQVFSNRTYVNDAFKRNAGMTFSEYVSRRRIAYVAEELKRNPQANIQELFFHAGFRHRSTAWRHYHKWMESSTEGHQ